MYSDMYSNDVKSVTTSNKKISYGFQEWHNALRYNPISGMYEYIDDDDNDDNDDKIREE